MRLLHDYIFTYAKHTVQRITVAPALIAYGLSQLHDVWAYNFWKNLFPGFKFLWLCNNASTMASQLLDSVIFTLIAFWGLLPQSDFVQILVTTYVVKLIVATIATPFVYLARFMFKHSMIQADVKDG